MTDARAASRRRARSAIVANYIHEISTRHRDAGPKERFKLPVIRVNPGRALAATAEGCA
jgi:hypothetical protein